MRGVGGLAAEATLFFGCESGLIEDNVASAAFLFLVVGGMVSAGECGKHSMTPDDRMTGWHRTRLQEIGVKA